MYLSDIDIPFDLKPPRSQLAIDNWSSSDNWSFLCQNHLCFQWRTIDIRTQATVCYLNTATFRTSSLMQMTFTLVRNAIWSTNRWSFYVWTRFDFTREAKCFLELVQETSFGCLALITWVDYVCGQIARCRRCRVVRRCLVWRRGGWRWGWGGRDRRGDTVRVRVGKTLT